VLYVLFRYCLVTKLISLIVAGHHHRSGPTGAMSPFHKHQQSFRELHIGHDKSPVCSHCQRVPIPETYIDVISGQKSANRAVSTPTFHLRIGYSTFRPISPMTNWVCLRAQPTKKTKKALQRAQKQDNQ